MGLYVYQLVAGALIFGTLALRLGSWYANSKQTKAKEMPGYVIRGTFPFGWAFGILDLMAVYFILTNWELVWSKIQHLFAVLP